MTDIVYVYRDSGDDGKELRHSLRSLKYYQQDIGGVFIVGDAPSWISSHITHIKIPRVKGRTNDVQHSLLAITNHPDISDDFILFNDDIYLTEPQHYKTTHAGGIKGITPGSFHMKRVVYTCQWLTENHRVTNPLNYDTHVPIKYNKTKLRQALELTMPYNNTNSELYIRSVYGNLNRIGGEFSADMKTRSSRLKQAPIISTNEFTDELTQLFPKPSKYEADTTQTAPDTLPTASSTSSTADTTATAPHTATTATTAPIDNKEPKELNKPLNTVNTVKKPIKRRKSRKKPSGTK